LRDTFDIIQSIHTDNDFLPLELFLELSNPCLALWFLQFLPRQPPIQNANPQKERRKGTNDRGGTYLREFFRVNANGDGPDVDGSAFVLDGVGHGRKI
jgi:hypothetical protein